MKTETNRTKASPDPVAGRPGLPRCNHKASFETGTWIDRRTRPGWKKHWRSDTDRPAALSTYSELPLHKLEDLPILTRQESVGIARDIWDDLGQTGCLQRGVSEMDWVRVVGTLALQPDEVDSPGAGPVLPFGGFDSAWRYLATGLRSVPRKGFQGWRIKLGKDPRYALRSTFLISMFQGWGVMGRDRWASHSPWFPRRPEFRPAWEEWLGGTGGEPCPICGEVR